MTTLYNFLQEKSVEIEHFNNASELTLALKRKVFFLKENKRLKDLGLITRYKSSRSITDFTGNNYERIVSNMVKVLLRNKMEEAFPRFTTDVSLRKDRSDGINYVATINDANRRDWTNGRNLYQAVVQHWRTYRNNNQTCQHVFNSYSLQRGSRLDFTFRFNNSGLLNGSKTLEELISEIDPIATILNQRFDTVLT